MLVTAIIPIRPPGPLTITASRVGIVQRGGISRSRGPKLGMGPAVGFESRHSGVAD